jgi:hypothetical protein
MKTIPKKNILIFAYSVFQAWGTFQCSCNSFLIKFNFDESFFSLPLQHMGKLINGKRSRAVCFEGKENGSSTLVQVNIGLDFCRRPSNCKTEKKTFLFFHREGFFYRKIIILLNSKRNLKKK